jgi:hypothetical protein
LRGVKKQQGGFVKRASTGRMHMVSGDQVVQEWTPPQAEIKGVLFDIDGTLFDSVSPCV